MVVLWLMKFKWGECGENISEIKHNIGDNEEVIVSVRG